MASLPIIAFLLRTNDMAEHFSSNNKQSVIMYHCIHLNKLIQCSFTKTEIKPPLIIILKCVHHRISLFSFFAFFQFKEMTTMKWDWLKTGQSIKAQGWESTMLFCWRVYVDFCYVSYHLTPTFYKCVFQINIVRSIYWLYCHI